MKILEKSGGDRIMLICEGVSQKEGEVSIKLVGNGKVINIPAWVLHSTECFAKPKTTYLALPKDLSMSEVAEFEYVEFI